MSVTVYTPEDKIEFDKGRKWFIDESNNLHIIGADKAHVGVIAAGKWQHATDSADQIQVQIKTGFDATPEEFAQQVADALRKARNGQI